MTTNSTRILGVLTAIAFAAILRLIPHPPNFTPIGAMALFGGAYLGRRALAFAAPLGAMLLSDIFLGFYRGMNFVYLSVALIVMIGWAVQSRRQSILPLAAAAIASSVLFFLLTNLGMWMFSGLYPRTADGLIACYVAAIPFFQNSVAGDLFYTALLFGDFAMAQALLPRLRAGAPQAA